MECVCVCFGSMKWSAQLKYAITYFAIHFLFIFHNLFSVHIPRLFFSYSLSLSMSLCLYLPVRFVCGSFLAWFFLLLPFEKLHHSDLCECVQSRGFRGHYIIVRVLCVDAIYLKYHKSKGMTQSSRSLSVQRQWQRLKATESQNEKNKYTLLRMESNFMKTCCCLRTRMRRKQHEYILTTSSTNLCTSTHVESQCQTPTQPIFQLLHL